MNDKLTLVKDTGEQLVVDLLTVFQLQTAAGAKTYIIMTANELDPNGLIRLQVSEVVGNALVTISQEAEWNAVKDVMKSIISGSMGTHTYATVPATLNCSNDFTRIIAVRDTAKEQIRNDYKAHQPAPQEVTPAPAPSIFPEANTISASNEVAPGISIEEPVTPIVETPAPVAEVPSPVIESTPVAEQAPVEEPVIPTPAVAAETPAVPEQAVVQEKTPKEVLMEKISAAVDEYLASI